MKYRVSIITIEEVGYTAHDYQKISDQGNISGNGPVYGYVDHPSTKHVENDVYVQEVDTLDIVKVIAAVNGQ